MIRFLRIALIITFLLWGNSNFASNEETCKEKQKSDIDLSAEFCKPRDQDSIGWCYAYAASDLLTQHLKKKKIIKNDCSTMVSAVALAASYNKDRAAEHREMIKQKLSIQTSTKLLEEESKKVNKRERKYLEKEGGDIDDSIELALKNGICLEKDVPSDDYKYSKVGGCLASESGGCGLKNLINTIYQYKTEGVNYCAALSASKTIAPNLNENIIKNILIEMEATNVVNTLLQASCKKVNYEQKPWWKRLVGEGVHIDTHDGLANFSQIDKELSNGFAVGIAYYSNYIVSPPGKGQKKGAHASLIVGKKFDCKRGEVYIVRNSWGHSCSQFLSYNTNEDEIDKCKNLSYTSEEIKFSIESIDRISSIPQNQRTMKDRALFSACKKNIADSSSQILLTPDEKLREDNACETKWTKVVPVNPGVTCKDGLLFIDKSIMKDSIYSTTSIK